MMRNCWSKQAFGWRHILYWSTGYEVVLLVGILLVAGGLSYMIYFNQFHQRYQFIHQRYQHRQQHLTQGLAWVRQTQYYQQLHQQQRQAFTMLTSIDEINLPTIFTQITQLSKQYDIFILQLKQQQNNPWVITLEVKTDFWSFLRLMQGLIQLPYTLHMTQMTLTQTDDAPDLKRLNGTIVLETYAYQS